jgi:hypothetical protein
VAARHVSRTVAACRDVGRNNVGGELPAQYSALTKLRSWCAIRSDPGGCSERLWLLHHAGGRRKLAGMQLLAALAQRCRLGPCGLRRHTQWTTQCETICIVQLICSVFSLSRIFRLVSSIRLWHVAARRVVLSNNISGELPVQYSVLTNLQFWWVTPDPDLNRSDPEG